MSQHSTLLDPSVEIQNRRILVIDDNRDIHSDYRKVLCGRRQQRSALAIGASLLFGETEQARDPSLAFQMDSAFQGEEGRDKALAAVEAGEPYAVAFVDMRMPPGWDGLRTVRELWKCDPNLEIVVCTAYSDRSWSDFVREFGETPNLIILKKPFDPVEVLQMASCLCQKWALARKLEARLTGLEHLNRESASELYQALKSRSDLMANISHELLTPLNQIMGFATILEDTDLDEEQRTFITEVCNSSTRLLALVQDVLAYNNLIRDNLSINKVQFDLRTFLQETMLAYQSVATGKAMALEASVAANLPALIEADRAKIRHVLDKLIDNALKFSDSGVVRVEAEIDSGDPSMLAITVSDQGPGIAPDLAHKLANSAFMQGDGSSTRIHGGVGVGLTLSRKLVQAMGGRLSISNNGGAVIRFTVPLQ